MNTIARTIFAAALLCPLAAHPAAAEEPSPSPAALLFGKRCGSCHTIGDGDRTGPDLLGVTKRRKREWIAGFVRNPGAAIDGGDPVASELFAKFKNVKMPEQQLSDEDLAGLFAYFDDCIAKGGCKLALGKVKHASEATAQEIEFGRLLFEGRRPLLHEGPACISCHNVRGTGLVGGGTLAKDLTFAYARLGDAGVSGALETTPFPLMKDIYPTKQLQPNEAYALKAFLAATARDGTPPRQNPNFVYLGLFGWFVALGTIGAAWQNRLRGVRAGIVHPARAAHSTKIARRS